MGGIQDQREAAWEAKIAVVTAEQTTPAEDAPDAEWDEYYWKCEQSYDLAREMRYASGWPTDF